MKILFTNEAPLIKYGLAEGFRQTGHQVMVIQGEEERIWGRPAAAQVIRIETALAGFEPDLVFTEGNPGFDIDTVCGVIKESQIPHFYWAIEDPVCPHLSKAYAQHVDYIFTTTEEALPWYGEMGRKAEVMLFGCNPAFHRYTAPKPEYLHDLVLVASNYSSRYEEAQWFIIPLVEMGYDIKIWGIWWDDPNRPVNLLPYPGVYQGMLPYEELPSLYSSAKIILGMNCDDSSKTQTSMRPYEALACGGGLYLGHYTKAQSRIFGDWIFQARNTMETLRLVDRILTMPEADRQRRARAAQGFVSANHNYGSRAHQICRAYRKNFA